MGNCFKSNKVTPTTVRDHRPDEQKKGEMLKSLRDEGLLRLCGFRLFSFLFLHFMSSVTAASLRKSS